MPFKSLSRKAPPPPLDFNPSSSSSRDRTTTGPSTAPYKHYNPSPLTPTSAPAFSQASSSPASPTSFKFWKRKTSSSSPTDASFPPTPPSHNNTPRHAPNAYASSSATPLRASFSDNRSSDFGPGPAAVSRPRQASYGGAPFASSSHQGQAHPSEAYRAPLHQQQQQHASSQAPQLSNSSSSRSALFFDEDYDWANGRQPPSSSGAHPQLASSSASTYSNSSLPRQHQPARPSPPGSYRSLPPGRSAEVPLSAPLPIERRESDSPKLYVSTRRTGTTASPAGFGSHTGWGGPPVAAVPPRRESAGVPAGKPRMTHGRKRSSSMSNLNTFTSPVLVQRPALDDTSVMMRTSSRRGPSPSFRPAGAASSSRPGPSRATSPFANTPSPTTPTFGFNHHLQGMGPPVVRAPLQLTGLPVVVVVPATPDTAAVEGKEKGSRNSGGWGEATKVPLPPAASVAVDLAKKMEQDKRPVVAAPVSSRPQVPSRPQPTVEDAKAAILIAEAAMSNSVVAPAASVEIEAETRPENPSPRKASIRLPDIDIQELGLSFFDHPDVEPVAFDTPRAAPVTFSPTLSEEDVSPLVAQEEDRPTTPVAKVRTRSRSGSQPLSSPPKVPLPATPTEEDQSTAEVESEEQDEEAENDALVRAGREESHSSMPSLSSSFSVDSSVSGSSSEADWSNSPDLDAASESGEGLDEALSQMINSLSTSDSSSSSSPFALQESTKPVYSPPYASPAEIPTIHLQEPASPSSVAATLTPKANGNRPLPHSASDSSFVSASSSILRSPSPTPWHQFPLPPPHTSTSEPALSGLTGLGLGIEEADLQPPRKRQIPSPMLVRDHRRPFYLSASTGCLADKASTWDETPTAPTAATFAPILVVSPPPPSGHRSTFSVPNTMAQAPADLISFDSPAMGASLSPVLEQKAHLSASSSSSSLASDASGESMFSAEEELGTVSISHVQTTTAVRWAFARSGSGASQQCEREESAQEIEAEAGWAM